MKHTLSVLTILTVLSTLLTALCSCHPDPYEDPPFSLYKTRADYFEYYNVDLDKHGLPKGNRAYSIDDSRIRIIDNDTVYTFRVRLDNDYVLCGESTVNSQFTDIRIPEMVKLSSEGKYFSDTELKDRIIDPDPFTEFYSVPSTYIYEASGTISEALLMKAIEINEIIKEGKLEDHFTKLK